MRRLRGGARRGGPAIWIGAVSLPILAFFLWRFPVPVDAARVLTVLRDLGTALLMLATAALAGRLALRSTGLDRVLRTPADRLLCSCALGYGLEALAAFAAAATGLLRPTPWIAGAALLWLLGRRGGVLLEEDLRALWNERVPADGVRIAVTVALSMTMAMMMLEAMAPPTAYDALRYHLELPRRYAEAGGFVPVGYDFNAFFPQNIDLLFALAFVVGAPGAASLTHLLLGWLAAATAGRLASSLAGPGAALPAAAIFYTMPVVAINSAWAYVDLGLALFILLAVHAARGFWEEGSLRWAALAGIFAGLALGTKYTGASTFVVLGLVLLARARVGVRRVTPRRALQAVALFAGIGLLTVLPWLGRNLLLRGNPVYPFASSVFGAPPGDTYRAARHAAVLDRPEVPTSSAADLLLLPWRFTMSPWVRDEMIGPALLASVPVVLLAAVPGAGWFLAVASGYGGLWLAQSPQMRLYLHGLGILAAIAGASWFRLRRRGGAAAAISSTVLLASMAASMANLAVMQRALSDPFPVVVGMESRDRYLKRHIDGYAAIDFINRELPADARVLFIGEIYGFYCERAHVLGSKFDRAPIVDWIAGAGDLDGFLERLRRERITHVLYSQVQLRKFARLPGGPYLDWPDERSRAVYREFMTGYLEPVYEDEDAIVARVRSAPRPAPGNEPTP